MSWLSLVPPIAATISALAGTTAAVVAAIALQRNREDQARRDAAGLHAAVYMASQRYPPGQELRPNEEPSDRTDFWLVAKVTNASSHPYYAVATSMVLASRQKRFAAIADIIPPNSSRYARLTLVDGCDVVPLGSDTLLTTTFIDSQGRGWRRDSEGRLQRHRASRRWSKAEIFARPNRAATLHQIGEMINGSPNGYDVYVVRDSAECEVEVSTLEAPASEKDVDEDAFPAPVWEPRPTD